ncbi:MAG: tetratricopeptide repeat protein, partial [Gemmatimonadota bacterium]
SSLAHVRYSRGDFADAERLHREALRLTRARHGNRGVEVASRLQALGAFLDFTSRPEAAEPLLEESLTMLRRTYGDNHPLVVNGIVALGDAQSSNSHFAAADSTFREGLRIARALYGQEHPTVADLIARLGTVQVDQRKLEAAEPLIREALAMRVRLLGEQHPDVQLARTDLARLLEEQVRYPEADSLLNQALLARRSVLGDSSPAVAATLVDLGYSAANQDNWAGAIERYREALPIWRAAGIADNEVETQAQLGWALYKLGKLDEAEPILTEVLVRRRAMYGEGHRMVGDAYEKLAGLAVARGNIARAESLSVLGLEIRRTVFGPQSPAVAGQLQNVAFMREKQNDSSGAIVFLRQSLAMTHGFRPENDPNLLAIQQWLAIDLCATGAVAEGDSLLRAAIAVAPRDSTLSIPYRLRGSLGYCLALQRKFSEAEPLLLEAEAGLRALPSATLSHRELAITRLVDLYERWGKAAEATEWRGRVAVSQH